MASVSCPTHLLAILSSREPEPEPGTIVNGSIYNRKAFSNHASFRNYYNAKIHLLKPKAVPSNRNTKPNSLICADCDGKGAVACSQCKGSGVNPVDFFNGKFKAGESCWLCGGKKQMLCGNCNGAGFIGGFMSTDDE